MPKFKENGIQDSVFTSELVSVVGNTLHYVSSVLSLFCSLCNCRFCVYVLWNLWIWIWKLYLYAQIYISVDYSYWICYRIFWMYSFRAVNFITFQVNLLPQFLFKPLRDNSCWKVRGFYHFCMFLYPVSLDCHETYRIYTLGIAR